MSFTSIASKLPKFKLKCAKATLLVSAPKYTAVKKCNMQMYTKKAIVSRSIPITSKKIYYQFSTPKRFYMSGQAHTVKQMQKNELKSLIESHPDDYVLIDVREKSELAHGTIPTAKNIPLGEIPSAFMLDNDAFKAKYNFEKPEKADKVIFHCKSGGRSSQAASFVSGLGFRDVNNYPGYIDWFGKAY